MTEEQVNTGKKILEQIEQCRANIVAAHYTQSESVTIRKSYLQFNGIDDGIVVPETLFRVIGKLILSEYQQKLIELENEFKAL